MDHGAHYCSLHRKLFKLLGLWPYHTAPILIIWRILLSSLLSMITLYQLVYGNYAKCWRKLCFQIIFFCKTKISFAIFVKNFTSLSATLSMTIKYIAQWATMMTAKNIMDRVSEDWQTFTEKEELAILDKYTALGRFQSLVLAWFLFVCGGIFLMVHYLPLIMDVIAPLNVTRPHMQPFVVAFTNDHFYVYVMNCGVFMFLAASLLVTCDGFTIMNLQHLTALFRIISFRLKHSLRKGPYNGINAMSKFDGRFTLRDAFVLHQHSLTFVKSMLRMISVPYFILLLISLAACVLALLRLSQAKNFEELALCVIFIIPNLSIAFILHYILNQTISHSHEVFAASYDSMWYEVPLFQQKLLLVMMQKARCGADFNFIGLYNPSLENFTMCIKASWSYFMMMNSVINQR